MSTLRITRTSPVAVQRASSIQVQRPTVAASQPRRRLSTPLLGVIGLVAIQVVALILSANISQGAYQLAALKKENRDLTTQSEILAAEVDSLSSQQNLSDAAHALGMVANTNPVFLRLQDQSVIGKPKAAFRGGDQISSNLVPNSVLTAKTNVSAIKAKTTTAAKTKMPVASASSATSSQNGNVVTAVSPRSPIASSGSIQSSPTH